VQQDVTPLTSTGNQGQSQGNSQNTNTPSPGGIGPISMYSGKSLTIYTLNIHGTDNQLKDDIL
jgi:hypothetical protein